MVSLSALGSGAVFALPGTHSLHSVVGSDAGGWLEFCCYPVLDQLPQFR